MTGLFLVPFIPFIVAGNMYFPFITGKGFTFRILVEIVFGLYALLAVLYPEYRPKKSWITYSVLIFTGAILIADIFSVNSYKSLWSNYERMEGFVLIAHLLLLYISATSVFTKKIWDYFWNTTILASVIMSLYGVLQLSGALTINQGGVRVDATLGNSAYLAIYLVVHIFLCLYFIANKFKPKWQKWMYGMAAILETVILYYTATRGAILGIIGGLILSAIIIIIKEKQSPQIKKISYAFLGVLIVLVGGFYLIRNASFVQKSPVLSRFATLSPAEIKTQGRYFVWPMAIKGVIEKPIFGWGQESFNFVFNKYYDPRMYGQEQWFDRTHDVFLDWLIAGGIVGFLSYAGMYVALLYFIWKKKENDDLSVTEKSIFTGMIAAYIFHNIFVFDNLTSYVLFFSLLAYVNSVRIPGPNLKSPFYSKKLLSEVTSYIVAPVIGILTIGVVYFVNVPAMTANTTLIQAMSPQGGISKNLELFKKTFDENSFGSSEALEQLIMVSSQILSAQQISVTDKQQFIAFTSQKIADKIKQTPGDTRYLVFGGSFFNRIGQYDQAIVYLDKAIETSPKKQEIYYELGSAYIGKGDYQKAFEVFKKAYDLEPVSPESQLIYAIGGIYVKNAAVVKDMFAKLDPDKVMNDNRIIQAYIGIGDHQDVIAILNYRVQKDPTNAQNKLSLASEYMTIGQKQKAIDIIQQMIKDDPTFKTQGETYIKQIQNS